MDALKAVSLPPGFGFHPTDVELISHYLKRKNLGLKVDLEVIPELDIYKREPWDLPACCQIPTRDSKWHFFTSRDRKYPNGTRANRATEAGYWKSTGKDRNIRFHNQVIGTKKTLVFHEGRPPYGKRTDWIMHEYYMDEKECKKTPGMLDTYVLCRVTKRDGFVVEGENVSARSEDIDGQKFVKDLDSSQHEGVQQDKSSPSESTEDLDSWLNELIDPNFDGSVDFYCLTELPSSVEPATELQASQTRVSNLIPKDEPLDFGFLPEDILGILKDDLIVMPEITELLAVDHSPTISLNQQRNFGAEDFKKEMPNLSQNSNFIQIRERHERPVADTFPHRVKLVRTNKMESRNSSAVRQTIKCAQVDHCISANSKLKHPTKLEVKDETSRKESKQNYNRIKAGIDCYFLRACMIGAAGLIIYFLFRDAVHISGNFPVLEL
ncbi:NAC domain-containing protein 71-like [Dendrobium catenatum]|uniref:NAC domain-containing protein 74 n=1 Tax=Dendrobium catenatum TaxID=906689 RepID=A0A2I0VXF7_9ASPA|nr:NAC domain-containing protein 71-like [Dendrobium catenatum]PKU68094.1 NAC domain-containing protein 74 [Dendrobium catenatum]